MEKMISFCGITCTECPTFIATKKNDDTERKKVAELWTKEYGRPFKIEDINCEGCLSNGNRVFAYCNICEIRKCGREKNLRNCAYCDEYKCERLTKLHEQAPKLKKTLDSVRKDLQRQKKP